MNQRWRTERSSYRIPDEVIQTRHYEIATMATEGEVRAFIAMHHYLRSLPPSRFRFGLYRHDQLVGTAVFTYPVNDRTITNVFDCPAIEGAELGRLVLLDDVPGNGESWFVAECLRRLRRVGLAGVVSFSDPVPRASLTGVTVTPGHIGTVYQALNEAYLGRSSPRTLRSLAERHDPERSNAAETPQWRTRYASDPPESRNLGRRPQSGSFGRDHCKRARGPSSIRATTDMRGPSQQPRDGHCHGASPYPKWLPLWRLLTSEKPR